MNRMFVVGIAALVVGCTSRASKSQSVEIATARSEDTDFVLVLEGDWVKMALRKGGATSLALTLMGKEDVDFTLKMIARGMDASETPADGEETIVSQMKS